MGLTGKTVLISSAISAARKFQPDVKESVYNSFLNNHTNIVNYEPLPKAEIAAWLLDMSFIHHDRNDQHLRDPLFISTNKHKFSA